MKFIPIIETLDTLENHRENGIPDGIGTGWAHMDGYFTILRGQLNIVSGYPGHGKTEWVENIAVNLAREEGWTILVYAPESHPASKHTRSLVEKWVGKQMMEDYNDVTMTAEELAAAMYDIDKKFRLISADDEAYSFQDILSMIERMKNENKPLDMVVIDPWNEMESHRPPNISETDYIGTCLRDARRLARKYDITIWIVCHPIKPAQKNKKGDYDPPTVYDLAGSAHWYNKADNAFIVHRYDKYGTRATVLVKKIKNRPYGKIGEVEFDFVPSNSRFIKPEKQDDQN